MHTKRERERKRAYAEYYNRRAHLFFQYLNHFNGIFPEIVFQIKIIIIIIEWEKRCRYRSRRRRRRSFFKNESNNRTSN